MDKLKWYEVKNEDIILVYGIAIIKPNIYPMWKSFLPLIKVIS